MNAAFYQSLRRQNEASISEGMTLLDVLSTLYYCLCFYSAKFVVVDNKFKFVH